LLKVAGGECVALLTLARRDKLYYIFKGCWIIHESPPQNPTQRTTVRIKLFSIEVVVSTWVKDSHGLYDYEAAEEFYKRETYYIRNSTKVFRELTRGDTVSKLLFSFSTIPAN
jgi:hypothetical protein